MKVSIKVKIPKQLATDPKLYARVIPTFLRDRAKDIRVDFLVTTRTWKTKPDFIIKKIQNGYEIMTYNKIYKYVSGGTKPHIIKARRVPFLRFYRVGFRPKSKIRYIGSLKGARANKVLAIVKSVQHPGIQARDFDAAIGEKWTKQIPAILKRVLETEIRAAASRG